MRVLTQGSHLCNPNDNMKQLTARIWRIILFTNVFFAAFVNPLLQKRRKAVFKDSLYWVNIFLPRYQSCFRLFTLLTSQSLLLFKGVCNKHLVRDNKTHEIIECFEDFSCNCVAKCDSSCLLRRSPVHLDCSCEACFANHASIFRWMLVCIFTCKSFLVCCYLALDKNYIEVFSFRDKRKKKFGCLLWESHVSAVFIASFAAFISVLWYHAGFF